jgi:hypothetical protein
LDIFYTVSRSRYAVELIPDWRDSQALLAQLTAIYQFRGKQELYQSQAPEVLASLQRSAIIESSESSNRIEGIVATPARVRENLGLGAAPVTRSEAEIAGYATSWRQSMAPIPTSP